MTVLIIICSVLLYLLLIRFISMSVLLLNQKREHLSVVTENEKTLSQINKVDNTADIINLIRVVIDNNITDIMKKHIQLNSRYNLIMFDEHVALISKNTFEALNKNIFLNNTLIFTPEYLEIFIIQESTTRFLNVINIHNSSILSE